MRVFKVLSIQLVVTFLVLVAVDEAVGLFWGWDTHESFRETRPEPYSNSDYFSPEFLKESFQQPGRWLFDDINNVVMPANYKGQWFNVENNKRKTININQEADRRIYLFGGSTIYNSEVPDNLTVASLLSAQLSDDYNVNVVNMGVSSIHAEQQLKLLISKVSLAENDIVIFYDGVNDVLQRVLFRNQLGFMAGKPEVNEPLAVELLRQYKDDWNIAQLLYQLATDKPINFEKGSIDSSVDLYMKSIKEADYYTRSKGAIFLHFFQPNLLTKSNLNDYEEMLIDKGPPFAGKPILSAVEQTYPKMQKALSSLTYSTDLTHIFDNLTLSPYLDFCHVSEVGNKVIADHIYLKLKARL